MFGMKRFGSMFPQPMMMAPDGGGAGGGAGGGDGGAGGAGGAADDDKPMSRKETIELLNRTVTGAMKNWEGRVDKSLDTKLSGFGDQLLEKLSKSGAGGSAGGSGGGDPAKGGTSSGQANDDLTKELAKEREARAELNKRLEAIELSKKKAEKDLEDQTFRGALRDALSKAGIRPALMQAAMALHREGGKFYVKDGQVIGKVQKAGYEDEVPAEEAVLAWVKSDEGKQFLPPVDVGGGGDKSRASNGGAGAGEGAGLTSKNAKERSQAALSILATPPSFGV